MRVLCDALCVLPMLYHRSDVFEVLAVRVTFETSLVLLIRQNLIYRQI